MKLSRSAALLSVMLLFTGCSTTITNLTPSQMPRNPQGLYPFEVAMDTTQASIKEDTIQPYVMIGLEKYPMEATPMLNNRWEALVPIPASTNNVYYWYKFDYLYDSIPKPAESSRKSKTYQLQILDQGRAGSN